MTSGLHRLLAAIRRPVRSLLRHLSNLGRILAEQGRRAWARHTTRVQSDRTYRRTLVAAVTALATTMVSNPAVAAALGVWITETPPARAPLRTVTPEYDPDDDDDDPPPWRSRGTLWNTFGAQ